MYITTKYNQHFLTVFTVRLPTHCMTHRQHQTNKDTASNYRLNSNNAPSRRPPDPCHDACEYPSRAASRHCQTTQCRTAWRLRRGRPAPEQWWSALSAARQPDLTQAHTASTVHDNCMNWRLRHDWTANSKGSMSVWVCAQLTPEPFNRSSLALHHTAHCLFSI